jgi:hypothetical protein
VQVVATRQQMRDKFLLGGGLRRRLPGPDVMLALIISAMLKRVACNRCFGGVGSFVLGGEVAEADYTGLGHWSGILRGGSERKGRRDS